MSLRPNGGDFCIREQIIEDATGVTLQFEVRPNGEKALHLFGCVLPMGNRTLVFNDKGEFVGSGTHAATCKPAWPGPI